MGAPEEGDLLDGVTEKLLTESEIKARLKEWKDKKDKGEIVDEDTNEPVVESDDTQPLSKAEIVVNMFESKAAALLHNNKMTAGYFCDLPEIRKAIWDMCVVLGKAMADEFLSDFFVINKRNFS